jgi:hypothetical protein
MSKNSLKMEDTDENAPYEVFDGNTWEAGLLQSILADNEIESILSDSSNSPWGSFPVRSSTVRVFVAKKNLVAAQLVVEEFLKNMQKNPEVNPGDES